MRVSGATALVTGGTRGIGLATARELTSRGARVAVVARGMEALERAAAELGAFPVAADLSDPASVDRVVAETEAALGPIDLLVNNAALVRPRSVPELSDADLRAEMECNLLAPMRLTHRVLPGMLARGTGHVVNVSSGAAALPLANMSNYCAAKSGLLHYTTSLRAELAACSVGTTVVELGTVRGTQAYDAALEDPRLARLYRRLQRLRLMSDTPAATVARHIADAIESGRPHVRLPRGARPGWALNSLVRDATYYVFRARGADASADRGG